MTLPDVNIWLALTATGHLFHPAVYNWFKGQHQPKSVLFNRATQQSLLRLLTTETVMRSHNMPAMTNWRAWDVFEQYLAAPTVGFTEEPAGLEAHWKAFTNRNTASPKIWMDAYLAAFAVAGGHQLITTDKGFSQYPGLDLHLIAL